MMQDPEETVREVCFTIGKYADLEPIMRGMGTAKIGRSVREIGENREERSAERRR